MFEIPIGRVTCFHFVCSERSHLEDVYDLSWSSDGQRLLSGSVDNSAILWDIKKGGLKVIVKT